MKVIALSDMEDPKYVSLSGLDPGCEYVFCASSKNRHGYSKLSPISGLITTGILILPMFFCNDFLFYCLIFFFSVPFIIASVSPNTPNTPGVSHPTSTALTVHFELPHHNGTPITAIYLIIREGDRENGKCGSPLIYELKDGRPALTDDPKAMKYKTLYRNVNNRQLCMIRINGLSGSQQYGMQVAALNNIGLSPYSAMSDSSKTLPAVPPLPPKFEPITTVITPSSITVEWGTSDGDGGSPVCGYIIIAAMKTITKSLGRGSKKRRALQKNNKNDENDKDMVVAPTIITETSVETRAIETIQLPDTFTVIGMTNVGTTKFTLRPVTIGSYYRFRVAAYNRSGTGNFSRTSHPPVQVPNRNQYIALQAEKKRKESHDELMKNVNNGDNE
jgi:hypothetical protein